MDGDTVGESRTIRAAIIDRHAEAVTQLLLAD